MELKSAAPDISFELPLVNAVAMEHIDFATVGIDGCKREDLFRFFHP